MRSILPTLESTEVRRFGPLVVGPPLNTGRQYRNAKQFGWGVPAHGDGHTSSWRLSLNALWDPRASLARGVASMAGVLAAIDVQDFARHEASLLEVKNRLDDVGDLPHAAQRMQGGELRMRLGGMHWRLDDTERDGVHSDTALCILDRQRFGRGVQRALCERGEHRRYAGDGVVDEARRDLHDMTAALLLHLCDGELRGVKEAYRIDARYRSVIGRRVMREWLGDEDAGVIDKRVDAPKPGQPFGDRTFGSPPVGDVAGDGEDVRVA